MNIPSKKAFAGIKKTSVRHKKSIRRNPHFAFSLRGTSLEQEQTPTNPRLCSKVLWHSASQWPTPSNETFERRVFFATFCDDGQKVVSANKNPEENDVRRPNTPAK
ncbi:MAG: hypothetical protein WCP97_03615 [bacterium]